MDLWFEKWGPLNLALVQIQCLRVDGISSMDWEVLLSVEVANWNLGLFAPRDACLVNYIHVIQTCQGYGYLLCSYWNL